MTSVSEDQLRRRLRQVDELAPPDGFESKAWYAARQRLARRRAWTTGLAGAAVAVAVAGAGVFVLTLPRQSTSTTASGAAAPGPEQGPAVEDGPGAGGSTAGPSADERAGEAPGGGAPGAPAATATSRPSPTTLPLTGTSSFDWKTPQAVDAVAAVQATLSAPPFDEVFTSLRVDRSGPQPYLLVHLTRFDAAAMRATEAGFPPGTPIAFAQSAYSAKACATNLSRVQADEPQLAAEGYVVRKVSCDETGRVNIHLDGAGVTQEQVDALQRRYGDVVTVLPGS